MLVNASLQARCPPALSLLPTATWFHFAHQEGHNEGSQPPVGNKFCFPRAIYGLRLKRRLHTFVIWLLWAFEVSKVDMYLLHPSCHNDCTPPAGAHCESSWVPLQKHTQKLTHESKLFYSSRHAIHCLS